MQSLLVAFFAAILLFSSTGAPAKDLRPYLKNNVLTLNPKRTINIIGGIGGGIMSDAKTVEKMSADSTDPIFILLNSPGGAVIPGITFLSAMDVARSRGVKFVCVSGVYAASMAYYILAACEERYALKGTHLLFHPMRISSERGFTAEQLEYLLGDMRRLETGMKAELREGMKANDSWFNYHYDHETLWEAPTLNADLGYEYVQVVKDVRGTDLLFTKERNIFEMLFGQSEEEKNDSIKHAIRWE